MKRFLFSVAAIALTTGVAVAADLPTRKGSALLPPPPPPPMWTGFYAGLNIGYGFGTNSNAQTVGAAQPAYLGLNNNFGVTTPVYANTGLGLGLASSAPQNQNGVIGGGQVGYNYQWGSRFVIGLEADIQGAGISGSGTGSGAGAGTGTTFAAGEVFTGSSQNIFNTASLTRVNAGVDWFGTVRGRLGFLVTPTMLVYGTGGLTYGGVHANVTNFATEASAVTNTINIPPNTFVFNYTTAMNYSGGGSRSQTLVGWNVGGGFEWMFLPNWSVKAEGIYWNMGNMNVPTASLAPAALPLGSPVWSFSPAAAYGGARVNYQGVIARAGVNYHFNFGGAAPVLASY